MLGQNLSAVHARVLSERNRTASIDRFGSTSALCWSTCLLLDILEDIIVFLILCHKQALPEINTDIASHHLHCPEFSHFG